MTLKRVWKVRHELSFVELRQIEAEVAMERLVSDQEDAMFSAIEAEPRLLAELDNERDQYIRNVEYRITSLGWHPTDAEWINIKGHLDGFEARRKAISDPHGLKALADAIEEQKRRHKPSIFDLYIAGVYK